MKAQFNKFGPVSDYKAAHVALKIKERLYLGTIMGIYRDETRGITLAKVAHFNGEPWSFDPALSALDILERE